LFSDSPSAAENVALQYKWLQSSHIADKKPCPITDKTLKNNTQTKNQNDHTLQAADTPIANTQCCGGGALLKYDLTHF